MTLSKNLDYVLSLLRLSDYCPDTLLRDQFCQISKPCALDERPVTNESIPRYLIRRLFELNPNALELSFVDKKSDDPAKSQNNKPETLQNVTTIDTLHPLDSLLAIFLVSDPIFKQDIAVRLFRCRLAIPIFVPRGTSHKFLLWPLRGLTINYYASNLKQSNSEHTDSVPSEGRHFGHDVSIDIEAENNQVGENYDRDTSPEEDDLQTNDDHIQETSLPDARLPIVSFIRFKSQEFSKSHLINGIIDHGKPKDVFFHRLSRGYTSRNYLIEGTIELGCCLSLSKKSNSFICLNLRGNALDHMSSLRLVMNISEVVVVLCRMNEINELETFLGEVYNGNRNILVIATDSTPSSEDENQYQEFIERNNDESITFISIDNLTEVEWTDSIREEVFALLTCGKTLAEKTYALHKMNVVVVDEFDTICMGSKNSSQAMIALLERHDSIDRKKKALPLQGLDWEQLIYAQRELSTLSGKEESEDTNVYREHKLAQIDKCRKNQYETMKEKITEEIQLFIKTVQTGNSLQRRTFIRWLQLHLGQLSQKAEQPLRKQHQQILLERNKAVGKDRDELTAKLHSLDVDLFKVSIRMDHFVREMGQMYECIQNSSDFKYTKDDSMYKMCCSFPDTVSKLVLDGCSLEVMDGDLCGVAESWIETVLKSVSKKLSEIEKKDDVEIFVTSVVGNQSCGKSTFVNNMFGTDFSVSAGKATRGVHLQILQVHSDFRLDIGVDYVVVLDTEGISSPDSLSVTSHQRDNLLATFVLGLSDMALIILRGEHTGTIEQVLSVSTHAFLRMRLSGFFSSCKIVHLNVNPKEKKKMQIQEGVFVTKCNEAFAAACYLERIPEGKLEFKDIVQFSSRKDTVYIPFFLEGIKPMTVVSTDYIKVIQDLKYKLLPQQGNERVSKRTIGGFGEKIKHLWTAVISDEFVFEFRSTTEAMARQKLDEQWCRTAWEFSNDAMHHGLSACSAIEICSEVELVNALKKEIDETEQKIRQASAVRTRDLEEFFESQTITCNSILQEWKNNTFMKLQELEAKLKREQRNILEECFKRQKWKLQNLSKDSAYKGEMIATIRKFSLHSADQTSDMPEKGITELRAMFERNWVPWVNNIAEQFRSDDSDKTDTTASKANQSMTKHNIADDVKRALKDEFPSHKVQIESTWLHMSRKENQKEESDICAEDDFSDLISKLPPALLIKSEPMKAYTQAKAKTAVKETVRHVFSGDTSRNFAIDELIRFFVKTCIMITKRLWEEHMTFPHTYGIKSVLEKEKEYFFNVFVIMHDCENALNQVARGVCAAIETGIVSTVKTHLPVVFRHVLKKFFCEEKFESKEKFVYSILWDIVESEDCFDRALQFINDPDIYMQKLITSYVNSIDESLKATIAEYIVGIHVDDLLDILAEMVSESQNYNSLNVWLKTFKQKSKKIAQLQNDNLLQSLTTYNVNLEELTTKVINHFETGLDSILPTLLADNTTFNMAMHDAVSALHYNVFGCPARCPFCGAMCLWSQIDHDGEHFTSLHRPQVLLSTSYEIPKSLTAATCNDNIVSNKNFRNKDTNNKLIPYKSYKEIEAYQNWKIPGPSYNNVPGSAFWKWFCAEYTDRIAHMQKVENIVIPRSWIGITKKPLGVLYKRRIKKILCSEFECSLQLAVRKLFKPIPFHVENERFSFVCM